MLTIKKEHLNSLVNCVSKDVSRPNLQRICFRPETDKAYATNGRIGARCPIETGLNQDHSLSVTQSKELKRTQKGALPFYAIDDQLSRMETYPNVDQVYPDKQDQMKFLCLSVENMEILIKIAKANKENFITFSADDRQLLRPITKPLTTNINGIEIVVQPAKITT
jgi:hypothetical protein